MQGAQPRRDRRTAQHSTRTRGSSARQRPSETADDRPPLVVLAACLGQLGSPPAPAVVSTTSLRQSRDDWLRRLETAHKSESAIVAYRVAIDGLLDWCEEGRRNVLDEQTIVDMHHEQRTSSGLIPHPRRITAASFSSAAFSAG